MTYQDILGTYEMKNFPKSTLEIRKDSTFILTQVYPNPYLHPFPHPEEEYFITTGKWDAVSGIIRLIGTTDSMESREVKILNAKDSKDNKSNFRFVDEYGDTVPILFVQYSDSSTVSILHGTMKDFDVDLTKRDTLSFNFFGYEPWTFIQGARKNTNYEIEVYPSFRPNMIDTLYLKLRRNVVGSDELKYFKRKK